MRDRGEVVGRKASIRDEVRRFLTRHSFTSSSTRYTSVSAIYALYMRECKVENTQEEEERFRSALGRVLRPPASAGEWAMRWAVPDLKRRRGHISIVSPSVPDVDPHEEYVLGKARLGEELRRDARSSEEVAELRKVRKEKVGVQQSSALEARSTSFRYVDEFVKLECASDLCAVRVFPNGKELAESMAAFAAVRERIRVDGAPTFGDGNMVLVAMGDGSTPRTGAMFAFRTNWRCLSVDPALKMHQDRPWGEVSNLTTIKARAQDVGLLIQPEERVLLVLWHAHVSMEDAVECLGFANGEKATRARLACISCACCNFDETQREMLGANPDEEFQDDAVPGLMRTVRVWRFKDEETE